MGSILNFVSSADEIGNGYGIRVDNHIRFMHNTFTDIVRYDLNHYPWLTHTENYELNESANNILVYEVWNLEWLFESDFFLLNYIIEDLPTHCISAIKENKLKIIISNIGEASIINKEYFLKFYEHITKYNLIEENFIFIDGNNDLLEINTNFKIYSPNHFIKILPNISGFNELKYEASTPTPTEAKTNLKREKHFLSFNRAERLHRGILITHLFKNNLLDKFYLSALKEYDPDVQEYYDDRLAEYKPFVSKLNKLVPIEIDTHKWINRDNSFYPGNCFKKDLFLNSYFHICTETFFFEKETTFFTEKILKPILGLQPFIVVGTYHYLDKFKKFGFKTFDSIFDESYDDIEDGIDRMLKIIENVDNICSWDLETCEEKYKSVLDICIYNYNHLLNVVRDDNELINLIKKINNEW